MSESREKFWMVVGRGTPVCRHGSEQGACNEAARLARLNRGQEFVVLESRVGFCDVPPEPPPLRVTKYVEDPDDLYF